MRIRIKVDRVNWWVPVPLGLGGVAIRIGTKGRVPDVERKLILQVYKSCKKELKKYKGLRIVEVETANGERVVITL